MEKSIEEVELKFHNKDLPNFPGYNYKPEFRPLKMTDAILLAPMMRKEGRSIGTYLGGYSVPDQWNLKETQKWVSQSINSNDFPAFHYLFLCGPNTVVGMGSIMKYGDSLLECQLVLSVFGSHQGRGWGKVIASTLKHIAFDVWGFEAIYWINDATNRASTKLSQEMGFGLETTYSDNNIMGTKGSGLWYRWICHRPEGMFPGILQGADLEYWGTPKSEGLLKAVIAAKESESMDLSQAASE